MANSEGDIETELYDTLLNDADLKQAINDTYYGSTKLSGKKRNLKNYLNNLKNDDNTEKIEKFVDYILVGEQVRNLGEVMKLISGLKKETSEVEAVLNRISNNIGMNIFSFKE